MYSFKMYLLTSVNLNLSYTSMIFILAFLLPTTYIIVL